ncbi:class I SAM-dependent methyltransferase [Nocardioides sp.]|uniref:class I SAM-dependent methyltransferase n=1 Tax=Nocardioides sp. TaxID=35761 RepID=UPI0031FE6BAF|nr:methyltransferase small [Nocardioides sp.]
MTTGTVEPFGSLRIAYDERVLQPRPWTAAQSLWAAELLRDAPPGPVLELCAGAGQIGLLAIATEPRPLVAVDLNPVACDCARRNADAAGLGELVEVREGGIDDVLEPAETFALVIADPPWVRRRETGRYPEDPLLAIDGGEDGLEVAWACVAAASSHLIPGGAALLQLGTVEQADTIRGSLESYGDLELVELRFFDRGVLVRLDQPGR